MKTTEVVFEGKPLILIKFADGEGALAFPHQIEDGGIRLECQFEPGYAHIDSDGQIWRHGDSTLNANTHPDLAAHWRT